MPRGSQCGRCGMFSAVPGTIICGHCGYVQPAGSGGPCAGCGGTAVDATGTCARCPTPGVLESRIRWDRWWRRGEMLGRAAVWLSALALSVVATLVLAAVLGAKFGGGFVVVVAVLVAVISAANQAMNRR